MNSKLERKTALSSMTTETDCSICLLPFAFSDRIPLVATEQPSVVTKLKCGHIFHYDCVKQWFTSTAKNECPMCRQQALED